MVILFCAIVLIVLVWWGLRGSSEQPSPSATATPSITTSASATPSTKPRATVSPGTNSSKTYTQLTQEYAGRHIQFDITCQAVPSRVTFKNSTSVLFDNRSGDARIITIDGVHYNFPGYGYRILTLSSPTLPKTINLNCGAAVNVGQILLQK